MVVEVAEEDYKRQHVKDHCIYHPEWKVAIHTEPINAHDYCGEKLAYLYKGEVLLPSKVFPESRSEGCYPATNR